MKRPLLFAFFFCFAIQAFSQVCAVSTDTAHLDVNNARVILQASGDFFWDRSDGGFFVPKGDPSQPQPGVIFAGGLWLGGFDPGGNLKIAAQTYGASGGDSDWWPGPLDLDEGTTIEKICENFDKLWEVQRTEIEAHIADFSNDGDIDGPVPSNILAWPGRDNTHSVIANGFAMPQGQELAPFTDRNNNGRYEPLLGDYPNVPGDQAIWWVFNDEGGGNVHGETNGTAIRAEVHALAYGFSGANDENLANTTFYDFTIINRAKEDIDSTYVGLWLDNSIGCYVDDYVGCVSEEHLAFFHNSDEQDGEFGCTCDNNDPTYCEAPPVTAIKVLRGPTGANSGDMGFSSFNYTISLGLISPPSWLTNPNNDIQFYRFLSGSWVDGTPTSYGGNGYDPASTNPYPYVFDGNPADTSSWSLCNYELAPGYDYRILINSGPFRLTPGQRTSVCYAIMNKFGLEHPCPDVTPLIEMGNAIEEFCASLTPAHETIAAANATQFYPNPLVTEGKLTSNGGPMESVRLFNANGQLVRLYNGLKTNDLAIDRGGLPAGLYYYAALLGNGLLATGKIAIQ